MAVPPDVILQTAAPPENQKPVTPRPAPPRIDPKPGDTERRSTAARIEGRRSVRPAG